MADQGNVTYKYHVWHRKYDKDGGVIAERDKGIVSVTLPKDQFPSNEPEATIKREVGRAPRGYALNYELIS